MKTATAADHGEWRVIEGGGEDALIGRTIDGRYHIERVLGEGGMGLVYRCRHVVLNKPLAMKVLRPDVSGDPEILTRFRQEAQSASAIGNPHIIDISDFGALPDGSTYFIMEFLDGTDLTKVVERESPVPLDRIVHVARQLCDALGAAHLAGIVHRDLKPDNIYLVKRGGDSDFVKVLDFGIAKVGGASSKLTRAGQVFGTPHYMSPEQCGGLPVDHRTDIYAIGIMLYELVTGRTPFDAENLMGILSKHIYEAPVPPSRLRPDCDPELEAIVMRCIAKRADERYASCRDLADDLGRLGAGGAVTAVGMRFSPSVGVPTRASEPVAARAASRVGAFATVGLALLAGGAGVYVATRPRPTERHTPPRPVVVERVVRDPSDSTPSVRTIRLVTEPEGAEVWSGEALLGQTPLDVPRPTGSESLALELRAPGYVSRSFAISAVTLAPSLRYVLTPERAPRTSNSNRPRVDDHGTDDRVDTTRELRDLDTLENPWAPMR